MCVHKNVIAYIILSVNWSLDGNKGKKISNFTHIKAVLKLEIHGKEITVVSPHPPPHPPYNLGHTFVHVH